MHQNGMKLNDLVVFFVPEDFVSWSEKRVDSLLGPTCKIFWNKEHYKIIQFHSVLVHSVLFWVWCENKVLYVLATNLFHDCFFFIFEVFSGIGIHRWWLFFQIRAFEIFSVCYQRRCYNSYLWRKWQVGTWITVSSPCPSTLVLPQGGSMGAIVGASPLHLRFRPWVHSDMTSKFFT